MVAAAISDADGFAVYVSVDGGRPQELLRSTEWLAIGGVEQERTGSAGLSADGSLLALEHAEHGDTIHPGSPRRRPAHRGDGRRAGRRRSGPLCGRLVAGAGGPTTRRQPRTGRGVQPRHLGPVLRRLARPRRGARRPGLGGRLVARRPVAAAHPQRQGPGPPLPLRPGDGLARRSRRPRRVHRRRPVRPDGEVWFHLSSGAAPPTVLTAAAGPRSWRLAATTLRRVGRSSRGSSTTASATSCTASSSSPRATDRSP